MLYITHSKGDNYYISSKRLFGPLFLAGTTLEEKRLCHELSPRLFFVFLTAIFSNVPVLTFDVCSKCQRECLPKPAGKKKRLSLGVKEPERFTLSNERAKNNSRKALSPKSLRDRQIGLLKYFPNGRKFEKLLTSNSVPTTFLNSLFLKNCASGCLFSSLKVGSSLL